ncbi:MAG: TorF family putative porin [Pseudomonadota bacterium]|nr:TorF family putative porin [Pseudomonadota bacterium]
MRLYTLPLGALLLATTAAPALADDTAPPPVISINGTATLTSDYRFRGISQTDRTPAIQGSITVTHESGFYISAWGSTVDGYVIADRRAHQEIDLIAGYKKNVKGATFDIGVLYYVYPHTKFGAGDTTKSDFIEPYADIAYTFGPLTAKATINYAPKQKALSLDQGASGLLGKEDNVYIAGDLTASIPHTPIGLSAHLGHTYGPSWPATDSLGRKGYTDWGLGASFTYKVLTFGLNYVNTDATFVSFSGKNVSKGGVVASIGASF